MQNLITNIQKLLAQQQFEQALQLAQNGIQTYPIDANFYFFAAFCLGNLSQFAQAQAYQEKAVALEPKNQVYHFNAAVYASQSGHPDGELRAMLHYQNALRINPDYVDVLWNYGEHLRLAGHIQMAIDCFERLLALGKPFPKIYNRLAAAYECLGQTDKTDEMYDILLQDPTDTIANWGYATTNLARENMVLGWQYYNKRFECSWLNNAYHYAFDLPFWDGVLQPNMTLLIHGEQGLGDEMMFASTFNELIAEAKAVNASIIIGCKAPLARLFQVSFPDAQVFIHSYDNPMNIEGLNINAHLPMGHLIERYRKSLTDFYAHQTPYLHADATRTAYYNERIIQKGRESVDGKRRLRVGLMWGTVSTETVSRFVLSANRRSIALPLFAPLADFIDDVEFISLQNHERGAEAALLPQLQMIDFSLDQADFYDTAALIQNLDVVISVDTSVAHLAGGLGAECWEPLMVRPDWRHGLTRETSYWYNNTRYFRQTIVDDWSDVIAQLHATLAQRVKQHPHPSPQ